MNAARIRLSRPCDARLLPDVERSAGQRFRQWPALAWIADDHVLSAEEHLVFIQRQHSWVVVDEEDRPLGFICLERFGQNAHIHQFAVKLEFQGQGLGRSLLQQAILWAEQQALTAITLTTFREPPWNGPWYARMGFETLTEGMLSAYLKAILQTEAEHGLPLDQRQAMRYHLSRK